MKYFSCIICIDHTFTNFTSKTGVSNVDSVRPNERLFFILAETEIGQNTHYSFWPKPILKPKKNFFFQPIPKPKPKKVKLVKHSKKVAFSDQKKSENLDKFLLA